MQRSSRTTALTLAAAALAMLILAPASPLLAQEGKAKSMYAELLGDYEFDLAALGMGMVVINVYAEGDSLWVWPETSSEPAEMTPERFRASGYEGDVILISGFPEDVDTDILLDLSIGYFFSKPLDLNELNNAIEYVLDTQLWHEKRIASI